LTRDSHLKLQNRQERAIYDALKSKEFSHTPLFDELLLQETELVYGKVYPKRQPVISP
jgi:hypothetical protein